MESKPSWKNSEEGKQLWCKLGIALILILGLVAIWPWLQVALWDHQEVELYFSKTQGLYLGSEIRKLKKSSPMVTEVVTALLGGPQSDTLTNSIPKGTKLRATKQVGDVIYVDLSEEFSANLLDKRQEVLALYTIVNTLTALPEIQQVQILIEGHRRDTLHGNVEIDKPLKADHNLIVGAGD